jgi:hypothetical protein
MAEVLVDVAVEAGDFTTSFNDATQVQAGAGRVIIAASAWIGLAGSNAVPVAVNLTSGDPVNTCLIDPTGWSFRYSSGSTINYRLTTARVVDLG